MIPAAALGLCSVLWPVVATLLFGTFLGITLAGAMPHMLGAPRTVRRWAWISFGVHAGLGIVILGSHQLVSYLGSDALFYDKTAAALADHWSEGLPMPQLPPGKEGFIYMLAGLYWSGARAPAAGVLVNAGLAALLVVILWKITVVLFDAEAGRRILPLATFLPGLVIWPSQLLRDAGVFCLLAIVTSSGLSLARRVGPLALTSFAVSAALLFTFRGPVAFLAASATVLGLLASSRLRPARLGAGIGAASAVLVTVLAFGIGLSGLRFSRELNLKEVNAIRLDSSGSAASGFAPEVDISTPDRAVAYLPKGVGHFLLGPPPWQARPVRQIPALIDALAWWALLPSLWRGVLRSHRERRTEALILLVPATVLTLGLSLGVANFGTLVRQRTHVLVLVLPLIAAGHRIRRSSSTELRSADRRSLIESPSHPSLGGKPGPSYS